MYINSVFININQTALITGYKDWVFSCSQKLTGGYKNLPSTDYQKNKQYFLEILKANWRVCESPLT